MFLEANLPRMSALRTLPFSFYQKQWCLCVFDIRCTSADRVRFRIKPESDKVTPCSRVKINVVHGLTGHLISWSLCARREVVRPNPLLTILLNQAVAEVSDMSHHAVVQDDQSELSQTSSSFEAWSEQHTLDSRGRCFDLTLVRHQSPGQTAQYVNTTVAKEH